MTSIPGACPFSPQRQDQLINAIVSDDPDQMNAHNVYYHYQQQKMRIVVKLDASCSYLGCRMGAQLLSHWANTISSSPPSETFTVIITHHPITTPPPSTLVVSVSDTQIPSPHLLALSGLLCTFGQNRQEPFAPRYLVEMVVASSIALLALPFIREAVSNPKSQESKVLNLSCLEAVKYFGAFNISALQCGMINVGQLRGGNILDGGAPFYQIYECRNQSQLSVGNLEPKFYQQMIEGMGLSTQNADFCLQNHMNFENWPSVRQILESKFKQRSADEWEEAMRDRDTCVIAVRATRKEDSDYVHPTILRPKL